MDIKDFASIGSILFAIYKYFYPKNISKFDLCFVKENEIYFNSRNYKSFPKLQFIYNNKAVDNIKYLQFSIRNTGAMDVSFEMLRDDIEVLFPANYTIIESKFDSEQNLTKSKINVESNVLSISWDLLKSKEQINVNCLLEKNNTTQTEESNEKDSFFHAITIKHRIQGIDSIGKFLSKEHETQEKTKSNYLIQGYVNLVIGIIFLIQIPYVLNWILDQFSNHPPRVYEWTTFEIIGNILFILLSIFHILASVFSFYSAKQFK